MNRLPTLLLLSWLSSSGSFAAPAPAPAANPTFEEAVEVSVVNLEVFVTDRSGKPVSGLAREDFEVFENGRRVEITHFLAQSEQRAESVALAVDGGAPAAAEPERTLALFIDNRHLEAVSRKRVLERMAEVVSGLSPRDRFVLILYDRSLVMKSFAAADRAGITEAILRGTAGGSENRTELDILRDRLSGVIDQAEYESIRDDALLWAQKRLGEVKAVLGALERSVDALAGLPGHKALLYVTGELPVRPGEAFFGATANGFRYDASTDLERVVARANAGRVTLYGLGAPSGGKQATARADPGKMSALIDMAAGSGGQFGLDLADPAALARKVITDLATFYSLGYAPPPPSEGKADQVRKVKVRVKKPGLEVRHRASYRTKSGVEVTRDRTTTALLLAETSNPHGVAVDFGEAQPDGKGNVEVEVTVTFPLARLTLLPEGAEHRGQVWLFLGARDEDGGASGLTQVAVPVRVPNERMEEMLQQEAGYRTRLLLRPGPAEIVVGLRDEVANSDSTLVAPWSPPG